MPKFQNDEQRISYYKKIILPLDTLVQLVNSFHGSSFEIRINVKGTMISGYLVSLKEYHEHTSDQLMLGSEDQTDPEMLRLLRDKVKRMKDIVENHGLEELVNSYVCIRDPIFIAGNEANSFQLNGQYWIGKIESVDGFMQLSVTPPA
jgi:hypothetical protein